MGKWRKAEKPIRMLSCMGMQYKEFSLRGMKYSAKGNANRFGHIG